MILLQDYTLSELTEYIKSTYSAPSFSAAQVFEWLNKGKGFDEMTNVSKTLRARLAADCIAQSVEIVKTSTSKIDGTQKMLFKLFDGNVVEGVLMKYKFGNTLCVSTQVGCRMGCKFCASTLNGLVRNLSAGEILGQVVRVNSLSDGRNVNNVVLMGSGEPLDNFDNVVKFIHLLCDDVKGGLGFSQRNVTVSTAGLADKMMQLADLGLSVNLTLSLHSADQTNRAEMMPVSKIWNVNQAVNALRYYYEKTKRRSTVEYTLIDGFNDSYADALKLKSLLNAMDVLINVIRLNPVKERKLKTSDADTVKRFMAWLDKLGMNATLRRQMGTDVNGACGQLRQNYIEENK